MREKEISSGPTIVLGSTVHKCNVNVIHKCNINVIITLHFRFMQNWIILRMSTVTLSVSSRLGDPMKTDLCMYSRYDIYHKMRAHICVYTYICIIDTVQSLPAYTRYYWLKYGSESFKTLFHLTVQHRRNKPSCDLDRCRYPFPRVGYPSECSMDS